MKMTESGHVRDTSGELKRKRQMAETGKMGEALMAVVVQISEW